MDTYRIEWKRSATKELRSLPTHMVQRIVEVHVHDFRATICTVLGMANTAVNRWACFLFSECCLPPPCQVLSLAGAHAQNGKSLDFSGSRGSCCL